MYAAPRAPVGADVGTLDAAAFKSAGAAFVPIKKPALWPGAEAGTQVACMYDDENLFLCYELAGGSFAPPDAALVAAAAAAAAEKGNTEYDWARGVGMPPEFWSILGDDRVEVFLWVRSSSRPAAAAAGAVAETETAEEREAGESYYAIECNRSGAAIAMRVGFRKQFDFSWPGSCAEPATVLRMACSEAGATVPCTMVLALNWAAVGVDLSAGVDTLPELRVALCRGMKGGGESGTEEGGDVNTWTSWVDPGDDEVNFHRSECFGVLRLLE